MKRMFFLLVVGALWGVSACSGGSGERGDADHSQEPQEESWRPLESEVMQIHDEVMPKMGELNNLAGKLKKIAEDPGAPEALRRRADSTHQALVAADSMMWDWMYNYKRPENLETGDVLTYLEEEKVKVTAVREAMLGSMEAARMVLEETGGQ